MLATATRDQLYRCIQKIRDIPGVENTVIAQRDGYPLTSCGIWLTERDVFGISATSSAILSVAKRMHTDLSYVLIEGEQYKILLSVFPKSTTYFLAVTTLSQVNLGRVMLQTEKTMMHLESLLENMKIAPPLQAYEKEQKRAILQSFDAYLGERTHREAEKIDICITDRTASRITSIIDKFLSVIPMAEMGLVCLDGGYLIPARRLGGDLIKIATLTYTLLDAAKTAAKIIKRKQIHRVLCNCNRRLHFIYNIAGGLFTTIIPRGSARIGLLRLMIPSFTSEIERILQERTLIRHVKLDIGGLLEVIAR